MFHQLLTYLTSILGQSDFFPSSYQFCYYQSFLTSFINSSITNLLLPALSILPSLIFSHQFHESSLINKKRIITESIVDQYEKDFARIFSTGNKSNFNDDDPISGPPPVWRPPSQHRNPVYCSNPNTPPELLRNWPLSASHLQTISSYKHNGMILEEGVIVELETGDFIRKKHIVYDTCPSATYKYTIRGFRLVRSNTVPVVPNRQTNELTMWIKKCKDDPRPLEEQGLHEVSVNKIISKRQLIVTTDTYPLHSTFHSEQYLIKSTSNRPMSKEEKYQAREIGNLVCRWGCYSNL